MSDLNLTDDDIASLLAEGFHTAFRKIAFSEQANTIWHAIQAMDDEEWAAVINFVAEPLIDALKRGKNP